jgi:hypothetical protein
MRTSLIAVALVAVGPIGAIAHDAAAGDAGAGAADMARLTVEVRKFVPQAMHDNFGPGETAVYDATDLLVIDPPETRGRILRVFHEHEHDREVPADSPWRRVGQRLRMRLPRAMLAPGIQIFSGAVRDLEPIPAKERR